MRRWAWLALLMALPVLAKGPEAPTAVATIAPGELGTVQGRDVLIAAADSGRELFIYRPEKASVQRYTEKGRIWGDPIPLSLETLRHRITFIRMDMNGGQLALSGHAGLAIFSAREGSLLHQHRLFQIADVAVLPNGDYAAALTNVPHPAREGSFVGRGSFGDDVPRIAIFDDDGELSEKGLIEGSEVDPDPSRAMAHALRLSWGGNSLWAAEIGNYRVMELDTGLREIDRLHDPELDYQAIASAGSPETSSESSVTEEETGADKPRRLPTAGRNLASQKKSAAPSRLEIRYDPVLVDLDWGPKPGQLYWLLDRESFRGSYLIDRLDPVTGEVRRSALDLPGGFDGSLSQITVGVRFVWLRGYAEDSPIFRIDRSTLDEGVLLEVSPARMRDSLAVSGAGR